MSLQKTIKSIFSFRGFIYLVGIIILACGITLNTKTRLGVSPIISMPYCISQIGSLNFGTMTFVFYVSFIVIQFLLLRKDFQIHQLLQIVVSFLTSFFIDIFDRILPIMGDNMVIRLVFLFIAIILTGIGISLTVEMRIAPNPADGLANVIGMKLHRDMGFGKNVFDFTSIAISLSISYIFTGGIIGIGIGTILAMIFTGRVVALCRTYTEKLYQFVVK